MCKVPGDIVWERARNNKYTELGVNEFQSVQLNLKYRLFRYLFSKSLKSASLVIVPSSHLRTLCIGWGVRPDKIHIIHNSVDIDVYVPFRRKAVFDVVVINRLVAWKHVDKVIEACHHLNLSLLVVGDGPERLNLENQAKRFGKVTFVGEKSQKEIPNLINQARCFVLNSSFEATSYSLLEARSAGLFCIANAGTGSEEIIHHMTDGILCGPNTISLTDALSLFKNSPVLAENASKLARQDVVNRFDLNKNFMAIYLLSKNLK
jgi:glycosyltransferase involved in cell wall biosynthesis